MTSLSVGSSVPDGLIDRCYELYRDEYLKAFPAGGDEYDHDEAIHTAIEAVVVEVLSTPAHGENARLRQALADIRERAEEAEAKAA